VLFAFDLSRPTTAYALTNTELETALTEIQPHSVPTGPCLSE